MGYTLGNLFQFLLIQYAEGAVFAVVVQSLVTPLATLFWTFFKFDVPTDHFYWDPQFTETTAFTIVLMNVMMNVSLPIFAGTMEVVGGDTYVVLLYGAMTFPVVLAAMTLALKVTVDRSLSLKPTSAWRTFFLLGLCNTLNGVGVVFASPPDRTAPYLQGILATIQIPFTVFCRFLILRKGWIFILGYTLGGLFQFLLIKYAEGAVFAVVVQSLVTPLATLFWTFFKFDVPTDHFYWDPQFTETTAFTIAL
nr:hypothetical protein BaRGS_015124 [Batillaria attramentaria]